MGTGGCKGGGPAAEITPRHPEGQTGSPQVCLSEPFFSVNCSAFLLLCPTGPSSQRQVQNGPSPDEMDIQRR